MDADITEESGDFTCPVCHDIFRQPVLLLCGHSFCKVCLHEQWRLKGNRECPACKKISSMRDPPHNLALKNLCQTFVRVLKELLQDKLKVFHRFKENCDHTESHIIVQTKNTEKKIKEQFKKLHQFLKKEEEASIAALREEELKKSQIIKEKIEALNRDIETITRTIRAIEMDIRAESIMEIYNSAVERAQSTLQDPQLVSGSLIIDEVKHLGNLTFKVWDKMKDFISYTPVILDPNTSHAGLVFSSDLTAVRLREETDLPDNQERFDYYCYASEGFNSGTHIWDVEVGDNTDWILGVLEEYQMRKKKKKKETGGVKYWRMRFYDDVYTAYSSIGSVTVLSLKQKPCRIRVQLDWRKGKLSFSDPDTNTRLHTFTHTFSDPLFPFIFNGTTIPLKILPGTITAATGDEVRNKVSARRSFGRPQWLRFRIPMPHYPNKYKLTSLIRLPGGRKDTKTSLKT